ncbi:MAG: hypothetical protein CMA65_01960, partial [Euryarchaeota archaeon]|nr:hypothetical protein [Euryarchaeota archaeon]
LRQSPAIKEIKGRTSIEFHAWSASAGMFSVVAITRPPIYARRNMKLAKTAHDAWFSCLLLC